MLELATEELLGVQNLVTGNRTNVILYSVSIFPAVQPPIYSQ